jgi:hypothetical protein
MTAIILNENTRFGLETGAGLMRNRCAFTSRDMAADWPDAFTYAVVLGWDDDPDADPEDRCDAMSAIAERWGWDDEMVAFLRDAHERFARLADKRNDGGTP